MVIMTDVYVIIIQLSWFLSVKLDQCLFVLYSDVLFRFSSHFFIKLKWLNNTIYLLSSLMLSLSGLKQR